MNPPDTRFGRAYRCVLDRLAVGDPWLGAAMLLLVVYYVSTRGVFQGKASGDGWFELQSLRALVLHHTLDMSAVIPEYVREFGRQGPYHFMPNRWPIGPVFLWVPTYVFALGLAAIGHLFGGPVLDGSEPFFAWFCGLGTLAAVLWGCRATYILLQRSTGSAAAARVGVIAALWCTPLAWYAVTQPLYQHGAAFAVIAVLIEYWDRTFGRRDAARFAWLGALGGLAVMMRPQEVLYLLPVAGELLVALARGPERRRVIVGALVLGAVFALTITPQLWVWYVYSGEFHPAQQEPLRLAEPFVIVVLFSTRGGLFCWTPLAYLASVGLVVGRGAARLRIALLVVFAVEVYVIACAWQPTAGYAYGARRLSDGALLLGLGVAVASARLDGRRARQILHGLVVLCALVNLYCMELVRNHWLASSGAYPRTLGKFLQEAHWPRTWADRADRFGFPLAQPAGWLYALYHHVPVSTFDGVAGGFLLERDPQWRANVLTPSLVLDRLRHANAVAGLAITDTGPARVTGPVRLMVDLFAREPFRVDLVGRFSGQPTVPVQWNGCALEAHPIGANYRAVVPVSCAHAGSNDVRLSLPVGTELKQLDFASLSVWWK